MEMGSQKNLCLVVTMVLVSFSLLINSPTHAAEEKSTEKEAAKEEIIPPANPSTDFRVIDDFCNQRSTKEDRSFCALVFEPNPQTRAIKDKFSLLRVGVQFAIGDAMKTKNFLKVLSGDKSTIPPLKAVLEQCLARYRDYIKDLKIIIRDLEDDPPMLGYDARMANEALSLCHNSLTASKTCDDSILGRTKVATQYSKLIEEISKIL